MGNRLSKITPQLALQVGPEPRSPGSQNSTLAVLANLKGKWHKTFYNDGKDLCILFPMWQPQPYVIVECLKGGQCD